MDKIKELINKLPNEKKLNYISLLKLVSLSEDFSGKIEEQTSKLIETFNSNKPDNSSEILELAEIKEVGKSSIDSIKAMEGSVVSAINDSKKEIQSIAKKVSGFKMPKPIDKEIQKVTIENPVSNKPIENKITKSISIIVSIKELLTNGVIKVKVLNKISPSVISTGGGNVPIGTDIAGNSRKILTNDQGVVATGGIIGNNSSNTPLTAGVAFTGAWTDVSIFDSIVTAVSTDQNGNYVVQFSPDGVNIDSSLIRYYSTDHIEPPHRFTVTRRFARVIFTNTSASNQTYFRFQTLSGTKALLNAPTDSVLSQDYDALVTRPTNFNTEVALGRRQGYSLWNKFGYNADIDIGTEVIASFGGTFTPLTTATTLTIVSSSTDDDSGGIGVNSLYIYGIDANRDLQEELVVLNGTSNVVTSTTWLGINRVVMYLVGSNKVNVGTITITATTGGSTMAQMPAGVGVTQQCIFHVPRSYQFIAEWLRVNTLRQSAINPKVTVRMWVYSALSNGKQEVYRVSIDTAVTSDSNENPNLPFPITESTVLWLEATTDKDNTEVSARFSGILVRDVDG